MDRSIYLAGDSTCADNDILTYPSAGWGQMLHLFVDNTIQIHNHAMNGRSSKSFVEEGRLDAIEQQIKKGDVLLIQFGHNDQKEVMDRHTEPFSSYQQYLKKYIQVARKKSAIPILITSLYRRYFDENSRLKRVEEVHGHYPKAMIQLGLSENVPVIDLCEKSRVWLNDLGDEASKQYFMHYKAGLFPNYKAGIFDNTHLNFSGAVQVASIIVKELESLLSGYQFKAYRKA